MKILRCCCVLLAVLGLTQLTAQQDYPRNSIGIYGLSAETGILYERRLSRAHAVSAGVLLRSYYYDEEISYRRYLDLVEGGFPEMLFNPGIQLQYRYYFRHPVLYRSRTWFAGGYLKVNDNTAIRYAQAWIYGSGITAGKRLLFKRNDRWFLDVQGSFEYQAHSVNYPGYTRMSAFEEAGFRLRARYLYAGLYPRATVTLGRRW
ncbi:MAG: hypothetical protein NW241_16765 [Bacteroidia bacterium]|nr:hypothetical protein [Bacteroidia bacterium]